MRKLFIITIVLVLSYLVSWDTREQKTFVSVKSEPQITKQQINELTKSFITLLIQPVNKDYQVVTLNSKKELLEKMDEVATTDVSKEYVDFYYKERNGRLYIKPTELPPWFETTEEYKIVDINDKKLKIIQENSNELYGEYIIELWLQKDKGNWNISKVKYS